MANFKTNDISIKEILEKINSGVAQLPDFQRGWVWDDYRIKSLIASISNSYPVGALMFLEYGGESVRFKYRPFEGLTLNKEPEVLVLDGQQRLTSTFRSMFFKEAVKTRTEKNKEIYRYYYLDIEKCLDNSVDRIDAVISVPKDRKVYSNFKKNIELDLSSREKEFQNHMFPINVLYRGTDCMTWIMDYQNYWSQEPKITSRFLSFYQNIIQKMNDYKVPVITLEKETSKEAVCQVFENVNTGGVSLTVFELVTAIFAAEDFDLRKDWEIRENILNQEDILCGVTATDFLTAMTLISRYNIKQNGGEAISCKKKDVLKLQLSEYKKYADILTEGFIESAKFLKQQRVFTSRDLPYSTQLIPMAVIFAILDTKAQNINVIKKISRWYWCGVLGEMYGGANETRYVNDVSGVIDWINGEDEPDTVHRAYFNPLRLLTLQRRVSAAYKGIMALILQNSCRDFISGKEMDFVVFIDENVDIHHIFPKAYCIKNKILQSRWNSIVNKTPLSSRTNRIIGGNAPSQYLNKIEQNNQIDKNNLNDFLKTHLIDIKDIRSDNFDDYFIKRSKSILNLISNAMGKSISGLNSQDIIDGFGGPLI